MARSTRSAAVLLPLLLLGTAVPGLLGWCCWGQVRPSTRPGPRIVLRVTAGDAAASSTNPLMFAAHEGKADEVRALVAKDGSNLNAQDEYGWTALRYAVRSNHLEVATALIEAGADPNLASASGRTPLMSAAGNGLSSMLTLLLKCGADPDAVAKNGETAFRISMRGGVTGCAECRKMLETAATKA
mmetsp:Transcript_59205/g.167937  ORF Transcript_59205/g.167937 Transcript_59205/m.167937 type:complete len:186 (-) Transcript_59205:209-766(-)